MTEEAISPIDPGAAMPALPCIDKWRAKLLDFSGRNRSLFYRPVSNSLNLYWPERELWRILTEEDRPIEVSEDLTTHPNLLAAEPPDPTAISAGRVATDKKLKGLHTTYRTFLEEQGVHVLHLPIGWLTWTDETRPVLPSDRQVVLSATGKSTRLVRSPLLFVPVRLEKGSRTWRLVRQDGEAIEPNLTVLNYLKQLYDIDIAMDDDEELILDACLEAFRNAIEGREHWSVDLAETGTLDTFSFKKIAMLRELERSEDIVSAHPVLRALCGDGAPLQALTNIVEHSPLDEQVKPADVALAVPADSSQMRAVLAVTDGNSLVIQGPPGTGKSQTITNLISAASARGQSVLFVAEKKAARDVVVSNLEKAGLDDLVLHITEEVVTGRTARAKQAIADQLQALLEKGPGEYSTDATVPKVVGDTRGRLNAYVEALHRPLSALSWSTPFLLFHAWASSRHDIVPGADLLLPSIQEIDDDWLVRMQDAAESLDDLGSEVLARSMGPWLQTLLEGTKISDISRLQQALPVLAHLQDELMAQVDALGLDEDAWTPEKVLALIKLIADMEDYQRRQGNPLRFLTPGFWSKRSVVQGHIKRGGTVPADLAGTAAMLRSEVDAWQDALDYLDGIYPITLPTVDDVARLALDLQEAMGSFRAAQLVLRSIEGQPIEDEDNDLLRSLIDGGLGGARVREVLEVVLKQHWAEEALLASPEFIATAAARERLRQRFSDSDLALREYSRAQALNAFAPHRPGLDTVAPRESELGILRAQVAAKRRKPLRWLFSRAPSAILRLKPCIVASPLAVAQFLSNRAYAFDLVIFDEASQVPTADAVVAMSRGAQVVVVGDSQQMPPTSFFDRMLGEEDLAEDEFDFESVLQECEALLPSRRLLWHYRSQDERLIAFSNQLFYGGSLRTFPSSWSEHPDRGVRFEFVEAALYGRGGSRANPQEAERVVSLLAGEIAANAETEVAVTAMSVAQGEEIQARIEAAAQNNPRLAAWLDEGNRVKNLETVQGDECDVMLLSFGYGKDAAGNLTLNFGPLSREDGYRRLNVAVTRARRKTVLVSSVKAADIPTTVGAGGQLVRKYLDYAERGPVVLMENLAASGIVRYESPFEEDVANQLRNLGWAVHTQVGVGSYRVDLAVVDPNQPGRYLAGIECDGATYHSAESARDRDIVRQQVLERLGWKMLRVWSPDWFRNSAEVLGRIHAELQNLAAISKQPPEEPAPVANAQPTMEPVMAVSDGAQSEDQHIAVGSQHGGTLRADPADIQPQDDLVDLQPPLSWPTLPEEAPEPETFEAELVNAEEPPPEEDDDDFQPLDGALPAGTYLYAPHVARAPDRVMERWIQELVIRDGPLHEEELLDALRDDLAGSTSRIPVRTQIERGLAESVRNVLVRRRDRWYWPPNLDVSSLPVRVNRDSERRLFKYYPDEELIRAIGIACREAGRLTRYQLPEATARLLGYNLTAAVRDRVESLVDATVDAGLLTVVDGYYEAAPGV